jgi:hypothetical protein
LLPTKETQLLHEICKRLSLDNALLLRVPAYLPIVIAELCTLHLLQELFIVGDDNELEVLLVLSTLDDLVQGLGESRDIVSIKIGCWFVESNDLETALAHKT